MENILIPYDNLLLKRLSPKLGRQAYFFSDGEEMPFRPDMYFLNEKQNCLSS
jgi:hypothetical protein